MRIEGEPHSLAQAETSSESSLPRPGRLHGLISQKERLSRTSFLWPAVLALLLWMGLYPQPILDKSLAPMQFVEQVYRPAASVAAEQGIVP